MAMALALLACTNSPRPPNVVLITIDTLRADHVGAYGFAPARTPAMDQLALEGVRCANAVSAAPITMPAHSSIMTGLLPPAHGVRDNGTYALGDAADTLAERLRRVGYRTAAFVSAMVLDHRYNLSQGFEIYDDTLEGAEATPLFMIRDRPAAQTADHAVRWLTALPSEQPFFAWVHLFDPHQPYSAPPELVAHLAPYDAEIAAADLGVAAIVEALRRRQQLDSTLVVLTADHGESLGEHGELTHAIFVYGATVRVPLIWRLPGVLPAGVTYSGAVRSIDIAPTLLSLLGKPSAGMQGTDLTGPLQLRQPPPDLPQYSESLVPQVGFGMAPLFAVRQGGYSYIRAPRAELYDVRNDPGETHNLLATQPAKAQQMDALLQSQLDASAHFALAPQVRVVDSDTQQMLGALGYIAPEAERRALGEMDPKDGLAIHRDLEAARHAAQLRDFAGAEALAAALIAKYPANVAAHQVRAVALAHQHRLVAAQQEFAAILAVDPNDFRAHMALGRYAIKTQDPAAAVAHLQAALQSMPHATDALGYLGELAEDRGDASEAAAYYAQAHEMDPQFADFFARRADEHLDRGDSAGALQLYERTLTYLPRHFRALVQAGLASQRLDDIPRARLYTRLAHDTEPTRWEPLYNLACLAALDGQVDEATDLLLQSVGLGMHDPGLLRHDPDLDALRAGGNLAVVAPWLLN